MRYEKAYGERWVGSLPDEMKNKLLNGESIILGSKIFQVCPNCLNVVQLNKFLFGSIHVCAPEE